MTNCSRRKEPIACSLAQYNRPLTELSKFPPTEFPNLQQATRKSDIFIVATVNAHLDEEQAKIVQFLVSIDRRVIGIGVRNPYDLLSYPQLRTYLVTYEYTRPALLAAVHVLFGERQAQGHLPVSMAE